MKAILKRLESQGSIEAVDLKVRQVESNLDRAERDLAAAKATIAVDSEWAYTIAYHAMLRAGRALMFSMGYRPKGRDQHKTVVEFCTAALGEESRSLTTRFNRMRVKRHDFIYEPERPIPSFEASKSVGSAAEFVGEIKTRVLGRKSQKGLFGK